MTWGIASGIATLVSMIAFIGIVAFSYSRRREADFARMARMPLEEDVQP